MRPEEGARTGYLERRELVRPFQSTTTVHNMRLNRQCHHTKGALQLIPLVLGIATTHAYRRGMDKNGVLSATGSFVAAHWLRHSSEDFLAWSRGSGEAHRRAATFGEAIAHVVRPSYYANEAGAVARSLPETLKNCDALSFSHTAEAVAYAGLHLLDRYARVMQVLEHLMQTGRLPIRKKGLNVLEVGSGPAPALYAVHDFYSMLQGWPGRDQTEIAGLKNADSLERGEAWDPILHHVSEHLMMIRGSSQSANGLPFRRSIDDFSGFDVRRRHHEAIAERADWILSDFDSADEPIAQNTAFEMAYQDGVRIPSAYDLIFMCNFLTQPSMTDDFGQELERLSHSLTPGGVLVVMGGTGTKYQDIYKAVREIASDARLTDISPADAFDANRSPHLNIISEHTRANVAAALADCADTERHDICSKLPEDLWKPDVKFDLPKYQALAFVMQRGPSRTNRFEETRAIQR